MKGTHVYASWGSRLMATIVHSQAALDITIQRTLDMGYRTVHWRDLDTGKTGKVSKG